MSVGLGTAVGYLKLDVSGFASGVDSAVSDMSKLEGGFNSTSQGLQTIGGMFSKAGTALTAGFTAPIIGATSASVKFGAEFDQQMSNVKAVTGATAEEFEAMREAAISWGEKTVYTAKEAGEALYYMGLAGWDSQESITGLGPVLNLAAAGNLELGRTSDIVTDAITAFGLTAQDVTSFTNVLATAMSNSNTDVNMMGESFKYVAPVAGALGYSVQDVALALGLFANNGVKSSQAGTGLRQAFNALINPSSKAAQVMDQYGVSLFNADGSTKSFMTVMEELRGTFGNVSLNAEEISNYIDELGLDLDTLDGEAAATTAIMEKFGHDLPTSQMENLSALVKIFGVRALPGMLSVINASEDDFYGLAEKIYNADEAFVQFGDEIYTMEEALEKFGDRIYTDDSFEILGSAAGMAAVQMDNLSGDWAKFTSALGTSQILISDMVKGALRDFVQKATELVTWFNNLDEGQREQIAKWALIVASIGPVLLIIGKLISGIGSLITTFNTLRSAFVFVSTGIKHFGEAFTLAKAGLTGFATQTNVLGAALGSITAPMIAVTALIGVLVAAFVDLWNNNEEFRNKITEIWDGIKAKFEEAGERIVEIFNELGFEFEDFKELMSAAVELLGTLWDGFCEILAPMFVGAFSIIGDVIKGVVDTFVGGLEVIAGVIKGFKDGDWSMFWQGLQDIAQAKTDMIVSIMDHVGEAVWNVVQTVANWLGADWNMTWEDAKQAVVDWYNSIITWFSQLPGEIANYFTTIWNSTVEWVSGMISKAIEVGTNFLKNVIQYFSELPGKIAYFIGYALGSVVKWVADMIAKAREMGSNFLQAVIDFFIQLPIVMLKFITSAKDSVVKWATEMVSKAREMGMNFLNNIVSFFVQLPVKITAFIMSAQESVSRWAVEMVNKAREMAQNFLNNVVSYFTQLPGRIQDFISSALNNVVQWSSNMINKAREMGTNFLNSVVSSLTQLPSSIQNFLTSALNNVISWAGSMKQKGAEAAQGFVNSIISGFAGLTEKMTEIGSNIVKGIWKGISSGWSWLVDKVKGLANDLLKGAKDALGIESPSKEFRDQVGKWLPPGIAEGFVRAMPAAVKEIEDSLNSGINSIESGGINSGGVKLEMQVTNFVEEYKQMFEGLVIWFETMEERMSIAVESLAGYFKYLMYVRQTLGDNEFRSFILNGGNNGRLTNSVGLDNNVSNASTGRGGDVFNFYSPKAIDEVQAARMLRNTKRDLAEGF